MDLVSNFVGIVSPDILGENNKNVSPNFDLEDKTFSDLLEMQMQKKIEQNTNFTDTIGIPSGFNIIDLTSNNQQLNANTDNKSMPINPINENEKTDFFDFNTRKDFSTSEVLTFFNSLFESKPTMTDTHSSGLFDFERKVAAGSYGKYAKNIVMNLGEFVSDTLRKG